jgi:hypothetical protein
MAFSGILLTIKLVCPNIMRSYGRIQGGASGGQAPPMLRPPSTSCSRGQYGISLNTPAISPRPNTDFLNQLSPKQLVNGQSPQWNVRTSLGPRKTEAIAWCAWSIQFPALGDPIYSTGDYFRPLLSRRRLSIATAKDSSQTLIRWFQQSLITDEN